MPLPLAFAGRTTASSLLLRRSLMTLKSEVAELHYEVAELSSGELRLTFTTDSSIGLTKTVKALNNKFWSLDLKHRLIKAAFAWAL